MSKLIVTLVALMSVACTAENVLDGADYTEAFTHQKQTVCTAVRDIGLANMDQCMYMDHVRVLLLKPEQMSEGCDGLDSCYRADLQVIYVNHASVNPAQVKAEYVRAAMDQLGLEGESVRLQIINYGDKMVHDHE